MRFNIFRNPFIDTQVAILMENYDSAIRNQTEEYWRDAIAQEVLQDFYSLAGIEDVVRTIRKS